MINQQHDALQKLEGQFDANMDDGMDLLVKEKGGRVTDTPIELALAKATSEFKPEPKQEKVNLKRFKPFPIESLPEPIRGFVRAGAAALGCDVTFIVLPLLAALASSIGATRRIRLKSSWHEPAVIWAVVVAESGTLKSPSQALALDFLKRLQALKLAQLPALIEQYQRDELGWEADMQSWRKKGRTKNEPMPEKPVEPSVERYVVVDITIEALADRLQDSPRGVVCACDELAQWFGSFDSYRGGKGGDCAKWLSIHRAESLIIDRKTGQKTTYIPTAAVSLCGGIQPATLTKVLGRDHVENGLLARLLVVRPPVQPKKWNEATVDCKVTQDMERVFDQLLALKFDDDDSQLVPIDLPLSSTGKRTWANFYNEHASLQSEKSGALAAAFSKIEGYAARLALVVHLVRCAADDPSIDPEAIDRESVESGATMARWFANESERVYSMFNESDDDAESRQLVEWIERRGGLVTVRETQQGHRLYKTSSDAEVALSKLVEADLGQWETIAPAVKGGRASSRFVLSPVSTVYTTPLNPEENSSSVDVYGVDTPENTIPNLGDWGEI